MKTWKNTVKRGLSGLIAIAMCLSMAQLSVFAADDLPEAESSAAAAADTLEEAETNTTDEEEESGTEEPEESEESAEGEELDGEEPGDLQSSEGSEESEEPAEGEEPDGEEPDGEEPDGEEPDGEEPGDLQPSESSEESEESAESGQEPAEAPAEGSEPAGSGQPDGAIGSEVPGESAQEPGEEELSEAAEAFLAAVAALPEEMTAENLEETKALIAAAEEAWAALEEAEQALEQVAAAKEELDSAKAQAKALEAPEIPAEVKAFLDAVAALPEAETIRVENVQQTAEQLDVLFDAYDAMSAELAEREDIQQALVTAAAVMEAVLAVQETVLGSFDAVTYDVNGSNSLFTPLYHIYEEYGNYVDELDQKTIRLNINVAVGEKWVDEGVIRALQRYGIYESEEWSNFSIYSTNEKVLKVSAETNGGRVRITYEGISEGTATVKLAFDGRSACTGQGGIGAAGDSGGMAAANCTITGIRVGPPSDPGAPAAPSENEINYWSDDQELGIRAACSQYQTTGHSKTFWPFTVATYPDSYSLGPVVKNDGAVQNADKYPWKCELTVNNEWWANKFSQGWTSDSGLSSKYINYGPHTVDNQKTGTLTTTFYYDANRKGWVNLDSNILTVWVTCKSNPETTYQIRRAFYLEGERIAVVGSGKTKGKVGDELVGAELAEKNPGWNQYTIDEVTYTFTYDHSRKNMKRPSSYYSDLPEEEKIAKLTLTDDADSNIILMVYTYELPKKITGILKEQVETAAEAAEAGIPADIIADLTFPDSDGAITIPEGGSVKLLYRITVTGDAGKKYTVADEGAEWVKGPALDTENTLDKSGKAVIYVTKTFTADDVEDGQLKNIAKVTPGKEDESSSTSTEKTPVKDPEYSYRLEYKTNGENVTGMPGDQSVTGSKNPTHTFTVGEAPARTDGYHFKEWNTRSDGKGTAYQPKDPLSLTGEAGKTVTATLYAIWEKKITGFTKELVKTEAEAAAVGITATEGITFPGNARVVIKQGESVKLLYKITVSGDAGKKYTVTDAGAEWVKGPALGVEHSLGESGEAVIYVTKTFEQKDIGSDGFVRNAATITPGKDGEDSETVEEPTPAEKKDPWSYKLTYMDGKESVGAIIGTTYEATMPLPVNKELQKVGYTFKGWSEKEDGSTLDYPVPGSGSVTLTPENPEKTVYAVWEKDPEYTYVVHYDGNGDAAAPATDVPGDTRETSSESSRSIALSKEAPTRGGYIFKGWAEKPTGTAGEVIRSVTLIGKANETVETTVYAVWEKDEESSSGESSSSGSDSSSSESSGSGSDSSSSESSTPGSDSSSSESSGSGSDSSSSESSGSGSDSSSSESSTPGSDSSSSESSTPGSDSSSSESSTPGSDSSSSESSGSGSDSSSSESSSTGSDSSSSESSTPGSDSSSSESSGSGSDSSSSESSTPGSDSSSSESSTPGSDSSSSESGTPGSGDNPTAPVTPVTPSDDDDDDDDDYDSPDEEDTDLPRPWMGTNPNDPTVNIPDEPTPLANVPDAQVPLAADPNLVDIFDEDTPLASTPFTGDSSHTALWAALCGLSLFGAAVLLGRKKRGDEEK